MKISNLFEGRIRRLHFLFIPILVILPISVLFMIYGFIQLIGALLGIDTNTVNSISEPGVGQVFMNFLNWALPAVAVILFVPIYFIAHFSVYVRRAHDFGASTGMGVLMGFLTFIPYLGLIPGLYMLFKKGDPHTNEFGEPNKNSIWKNILNSNYKRPHTSKQNDTKKSEELDEYKNISYCSKCGNGISSGVKFCKNCGNKI